MKHGLFKRSISMVLALVMILGNLPLNALATETVETTAPVCEHSYDAVVTDATCTEGGYTTHTCAVCGDTYTDGETAALGHSGGEGTLTEATCTEGGYMTYLCGACGVTYTGEETDALGHAWGEWAVTTAATVEAEGQEKRICSTCGAEETRAVAKLEPAPVETPAETPSEPVEVPVEVPVEAPTEPVAVSTQTGSVSKDAMKAVSVAAGGTATIEKLNSTKVSLDELKNSSMSASGWYTEAGVRYRVKASGSDWTTAISEQTLTHGVTYEVQENYVGLGKRKYSSSYYITFKVYHNVTASLASDSDANAAGAGVTVANGGKVYHGEKAKITVADVADYKAEVYSGTSLLATLNDENGWTYEPTINDSTAYTVKYISTKAKEYHLTVNTANQDNAEGNWGSATLGKNKGTANEEIALTVTPAAQSDSVKYTYEVSVSGQGASYNAETGKVKVGTEDVTVTVTFTKHELKATKTDDVKFNTAVGYKDQLDGENKKYADVTNEKHLEQVILDALGVQYNTGDVEFGSNVVIRYWPKYKSAIVADEYDFCSDDQELTVLGQDINGKSYITYSEFAGRYAKGDKAEKVVIEYTTSEGVVLTIEENITLTEGRRTLDIQGGTYAATVEISSSTDKSGVEAAAKSVVTGADKNITPSSYDVDLTGVSTAGSNVTVTISYDGTEEYQPASVQVAVPVKLRVEPSSIAVTKDEASEGNGSAKVYNAEQEEVASSNAGTLTVVATPAKDGSYVEGVTVTDRDGKPVAVTPVGENGGYAETVYTATFTVADENAYTVSVQYGKRVLDAQDATISINSFYTAKQLEEGVKDGEKVLVAPKTLTNEIIKKSFGLEEGDASPVVSLTYYAGKTHVGNYEAWEDLDYTVPTGAGLAGSYHAFNTAKGGQEKVRITMAGDHKFPTVTKDVTVTVSDSRILLNYNGTRANEFTYGSEHEIADLQNAAKAAAKIPEDAGVSYEPVTLPDLSHLTATDVNVTIKVAADANYQEYTGIVTVPVKAKEVASTLTVISSEGSTGTGEVTIRNDESVITSSQEADLTITIDPADDGSYVEAVVIKEGDTVIAQTDAAYAATVYTAGFHVESNSAYTIEITYGKLVLNAQDAAISINSFYTAKQLEEGVKDGEKVLVAPKTLTGEIILKTLGEDAPAVTVQYTPGNTLLGAEVWKDLTYTSSVGDGIVAGHAFRTEDGKTEKVRITLVNTDASKYPNVSTDVTVTVSDSRPKPVIDAADVSISRKDWPAETLEELVSGSVTVTGAPEGTEVTYSVNKTLADPGDGKTYEAVYTAAIAASEKVQGVSDQAKLTIKNFADENNNDQDDDGESRFTVTYDVDGVKNEIKNVLIGTATPTIEDPTRTYYTFAGWTPAVADTVTADATYTAAWTPVTDNNGNNTADEEETYTVIYTDGVDGEEVFTDAKTENLAYGAVTPAAPEIPVREGWNFKGWDVTPAAAVSAPTSGNTIIYTAQWSEEWVVTFEGHTYKTPAEVEDGNRVEEPTDIWDEDHDFQGWYNGNMKYDFNTPVTGNLTLTAKWVEDYNRNDVDDADEAHFTVIYMDGETELKKFENVLTGLATPTIADPTRDNYKFNGWDPEVAGTVTADAIYTAQWLNDSNNNGVDDALETITVTVVKAVDGDKVTVNGKEITAEANTYVYDSNGDKAISIVATPVTKLDGLKLKSTTYVKSVEGVENASGSYHNFAYTYTFSAEGTQAVTVTFENAGFVYNEERLMNYNTEVTATNQDVYTAVAASPAYENASEVTIQYKARGEMSHQVDLANLTDSEILLGIVKLFNNGSTKITIDMPELWQNIDAPVQESVSLEQAAAAYLNEETIKNIKSWDDLTKIIDQIKNAAMYYDAHTFGHNSGNTETVDEKIRITYKSDAMYIEGETTITLKDLRESSFMNGSNVSLMYKDYTDEDLLAAIGAYVTNEAGEKISEDVYCLDVMDPYTYEGKSASDTAYTLLLKYKGDKTYKPCEKTFEVTITKAPLSMQLPDVIATYGDAYSADPAYTMGNKYGEADEINDSLIRFIIGLDVAELDVNRDGITGLNGKVQLMLPPKLQELLNTVTGGKLADGVEMSLNDLLKYLELIPDTSLDALNQALDAIVGITEAGDITITLGGKYPTNVGTYLHGAVTTSSNYETAFDVGYIIIKPNATRTYLDWNYTDSNGIFTAELLKHVNLGASAFDDEAFAVLNPTATSQVQNLFLGFDVNGELVAKLYANDTDPERIEQELGNGGYTQLAFIAEFGNELYYAVPIVRAFAIVPNVMKLEIIVDDAEAADVYNTVFDNAAVDVKTVLTNQAGEVVTAEGDMKLHYYGISTNTQTYDSETAPTHAGAYLITATYVAKDDAGKVTAVVADAATLIIAPTKSAVAMEDLVTVVYDGQPHAVADEMKIQATSTVEGLTPDTTVITAVIATDGTFSENGWQAVRGGVNVDFPKWVDALIAEHAPSVKDGITVGQLNEKLISKLPDLVAKLEELGATEEIIHASANLIGNVGKLLEQMPEDVTLSFQDDYTVLAVGTYAVAAVVTDSDHIPSMDAGLLVITPDMHQVYLDWNYHDENNIWSRELLKAVDIYASAYDDKEFTEFNEQATKKITYQFIGLDGDGQLKIYSDAEQLPNGIFTEIAYIELEVNSQMVLSDIIARTIAIVPNLAQLQIVDENGAAQDKFEFVFNNKPVALYVELNGETVDNEIRYIGLKTNTERYDSTDAPVHAGIYAAITTLQTQDLVGMDVALVTIEPAEAALAVTGGTVPYDGNAHIATVKVTTGSGVSEPDYTLISGNVHVTGDISEVGVDAFHGNVNIDFPAWLDKAMKEYDVEAFNEGVDKAYLIDFFTAHGADFLAKLPTEELVKLGIDETDITEAVELLKSYAADLLALLNKMPEDVSFTFLNKEELQYIEPGYYFYHGIVTDSDHYPAADSGLLIIEKLENNFDLTDTTVTYNGKTQWPDETNEAGADYFAMVVDRENKIVNFALDTDMLFLVEQLEEKLNVEIPDSLDISAIYDKVNVTEVAEAMTEVITQLEQLPLSEDSRKVLAAIQNELNTLPAEGTITFNSKDLPVNVGEYEVYAYSYSQHYKTEIAQAKLTILPVQVKITADDRTKAYGDTDPELTYTVQYFDHEGKELTEIFTTVDATLTRAEGEDVGEYAINVETAVEDENFELVETVNGTLTITQAELTVAADDQTKVYGESDPELTYVVTGLKNGDEESVLNIQTSREEGEDVGTYEITVIAENSNYAITTEPGTLTITQAELTVAADDQTKVYGESDPELTYVVTGLVNGDEESVLNIRTSREEGEDVGTYEITVSAENSNYAITTEPGTLTITQKDLSDLEVALDGALTYNGEEQTQNVILPEGVTADISNNKGTDAGNYELTVEFTGNYTGTVTVPWSIAKADVTATIVSDEITYGDTTPAVEVTLSNETAAGILSGVQWDAPEKADAGTYTAAFGYNFAMLKNWNLTVVGGKLTVHPKTLTEADVTLDGTLTYNGEEQTQNVILPEGVTADISNNKGTDAGEYELTVEFTGNHTGTVTVPWSIAKADVTATIVSDEITYGDTTPAVEVTLSNETAAGILSGVQWDAPEMADAGTYTAAFGYNFAMLKNWNLTVVGGKLTVHPKTLTEADVTLDGALTYNGEEQTQNVILPEGVAADISNNKGTDAGEYTMTVTGNGNYTGEVELNWTIAPKEITITVNNAEKYVGDEDPVFTSTVTGAIQGHEPEVTLTRAQGETAGTYQITAAITDTNYEIRELTPGTLTIKEKEDQKDGYQIIIGEPESAGNTIEPNKMVEIDGVEYPLDDKGELWVSEETVEQWQKEGTKLLTTYTYNTADTSDPHSVYPTAMYVWVLTYTEDSETGLTVKAERIKPLDNYLMYEGTSIRINFVDNAIRFFTSVTPEGFHGMKNGTLLDGTILAGGKLDVIGTRAKGYKGDPNLNIHNSTGDVVYGEFEGDSATADGLANADGLRKFDDSVRAVTGENCYRFTGAMENIPLDKDSLNKEIMFRPFMIIELNGEQIVLYGGKYQRTVSYVAYQNQTFMAGTAYNDYIQKIIDTSGIDRGTGKIS